MARLDARRFVRVAALYAVLGLAATCSDGLAAVVTSFMEPIGLGPTALFLRVVAAVLAAPFLTLAVLEATPRGRAEGSFWTKVGRAFQTQLVVDALAMAVLVVGGTVCSIFGRSIGAGFGTLLAVGFYGTAAFATRLAIREGLAPTQAIRRSFALAKADAAVLVAGFVLLAVAMAGAVALGTHALWAGLTLAVALRTVFEMGLTHVMDRARAKREADSETTAPRMLARGVETVEWVVIAAFLAVGVIGGYKVLATKVDQHTAKIGDCVGGEGACGGGGGGGSGGGGTGGTASGGGGAGGTGTQASALSAGQYLAAQVLGAREAARLADEVGPTPPMGPGVQVAQASGGTMTDAVPAAAQTPGERAAEMRDQARQAFAELDDAANPPSRERARQLSEQIGRTQAELARMEMDAWRRRDADAMRIAQAAMEARNVASRARERADQITARQNFRENHPVIDDLLTGAVQGPYARNRTTATEIGQELAYWIPFVNGAAVARDAVHGIQEAARTGNTEGLGAVVDLAQGAARGAMGRFGTVARAADRLEDAATAARRANRQERGGARLAEREGCPGGVCNRAGSCFAAGTPVMTISGPKPIESIVAGDIVLARDPETGATALERVAQTFVREASDTVDLELTAEGGRREHLTVTSEHPFFVHDKGFRGVAELSPGDVVDTATGTARVTALASLGASMSVFNFEVEHAHTYFVGNTAAWVHNRCDGNNTPFNSRNEAFDQARRDLGIPRSQQPESTRMVDMTRPDGSRVLGADGRPIQTREWVYTRSDPATGRSERVVIQDHSAGHSYGGTGDQPSHFNVRPYDNTRTGSVPGTRDHYYFPPRR